MNTNTTKNPNGWKNATHPANLLESAWESNIKKIDTAVNYIFVTFCLFMISLLGFLYFHDKSASNKRNNLLQQEEREKQIETPTSETVKTTRKEIDASPGDDDPSSSPTGKIYIQAIDEFGKTISGAEIVCRNEHGKIKNAFMNHGCNSGEFFSNDLPYGAYIIEATHPEYIQLKTSKKRMILDSAESKADLLLARPRKLSVKFVDGENNEIIKNASVSIYSNVLSDQNNYSLAAEYITAFNEKRFRAPLESEGDYFSANHLLFGEYTLGVESDGYLFHEQVIAVNNDVTSYTIPLNKFGRIEGSVLNEDGSPIFLADVSLHKKDKNGILFLSNHATTNGMFKFRDLAPGRYQLSANHPNYDKDDRSESVVELNKDSVYCKLILKSKKCKIKGVVLDNFMGKPIQDIKIIAFKAKKIGLNKEFTDIFDSDLSDPNGFFELEVDNGFDYFISIENDSREWFIANGKYDDKLLGQEGFLLSYVNADVEGMQIRLEKMEFIHGLVVDSKESPVAEASVWAEDINSSMKFPTVSTNSLGQFSYSLNLIRNKSEKINFHALHKVLGSTKEGPFELDQLRDTITLVLREGDGMLFGNVTIEGAVPDEKGFVKVVEEIERLETSYDDEGYYEISGMNHGEYSVVFGSENTDLVYQSVSIDESNKKLMMNVDLKRKGNGFIEGRVFDPDFVPIENVKVFCKNWNIIYGTVAHTDSNGLYRIEDLYDGNYDLYFQMEDRNNYETQLFDIPANSSNVDVILDGNTFQVQGALYGTDNKPLKAFTYLTLYSLTNGLRPIREIPTDENEGTFSFTLNQKGTFSIKKEIYDSKRTGEAFFEIDDNSPKVITVDLYLREDDALQHIQGKYLDPLNKPVERFRCDVISLDFSQLTYSANCWEGRINLLLYPGAYKLILTSPHLKPIERPLMVENNDIADLLILAGE